MFDICTVSNFLSIYFLEPSKHINLKTLDKKKVSTSVEKHPKRISLKYSVDFDFPDSVLKAIENIPSLHIDVSIVNRVTNGNHLVNLQSQI